MNSIRRSMGSAYSAVPSLKTVVDALENWASKSVAESWDNVGLLTEPQTPKPIQTVLLTNDLTESVAEEAVKKSVDLIISYHPPIFKGLVTITTQSWKERVIGKCIENRIAVYSPHTSWDCSRDGVSDWLMSPLVEVNSSESEIVENAGRARSLTTPLTLKAAIERYKMLTNLNRIRIALAKSHDLESKITRVAVCAGSGSSVLRKVKADLWITGEMSHHEILDAVHQDTSVILLGHCNSERGFLKIFGENLKEKFPTVSVLVSETDMDPIITV